MDTKVVDYSGQRIREITSWLREPVSIARVLEEMEERERADQEFRRKSRLPWWAQLLWFASGLGFISLIFAIHARLDGCPSVQEWYAKHARPGNVLWEYDTGPESWEHLAGERGYALVRDGVVVEFWMLEEN